MAIKENVNKNKSGVIDGDSSELLTNDLNTGYKLFFLVNFSKLAFFSILLIVPIYAITDSVINQNWIMAIIDILLVPVGFVHGLLLLFGIVD